MGRRGHSTVIGKFAKVDLDRRKSEIRVLGEELHRTQFDRQVDHSATPTSIVAGAR